VEFLVISLFHETKISMVDMKVHVSFHFDKKILKKMKSPSSMRNGRFNTSKLQKIGVLYTHCSKRPGPFPKLPKKKFEKKWAAI
jgi:hypothetical protein